MDIPEEDFLSFITIKQGLAPESIRHCMSRFRIIKRWFTDKDFTKENIERFYLELKQRGLKNNSLNTYHTVFCQIREYCKDRGLPHDFYDRFKSFKKGKPDIVIFTQQEIEVLLDTALSYGNFRGRDVSFLDGRYRVLTRFLAETGSRFGEAASLKIKHLNLSAGKATFIETKTNENRTVYITELLISQLKQITDGRGPDDYVFRNAVENRMNPQDYSADLKKRAKAAGITKRTFPHNFRHTYATMLLEVGVSITEVAKLLGHKDIQTTFDNYMHLADKTLQRAALRHPLVRGNVDPKEVLKTVREVLKNLHLDEDNRFEYSVSETENGLNFSLQIKSK